MAEVGFSGHFVNVNVLILIPKCQFGSEVYREQCLKEQHGTMFLSHFGRQVDSRLRTTQVLKSSDQQRVSILEIDNICTQNEVIVV